MSVDELDCDAKMIAALDLLAAKVERRRMWYSQGQGFSPQFVDGNMDALRWVLELFDMAKEAVRDGGTAG